MLLGHNASWSISFPCYFGGGAENVGCVSSGYFQFSTRFKAKLLISCVIEWSQNQMVYHYAVLHSFGYVGRICVQMVQQVMTKFSHMHMAVWQYCMATKMAQSTGLITGSVAFLSTACPSLHFYFSNHHGNPLYFNGLFLLPVPAVPSISLRISTCFFSTGEGYNHANKLHHTAGTNGSSWKVRVINSVNCSVTWSV